jgi:aminopeptidase N
MDWWNELWLKEGFATWIGSYAIDHLYPGNIPFSPDPRFLLTLNLQNGMFGHNLSYVESQEVFPAVEHG